MTDPDRVLLEQMQGLIEKWRDAAVWEFDDMSNTQSAQTYDQCADDLAALLRALLQSEERKP